MSIARFHNLCPHFNGTQLLTDGLASPRRKSLSLLIKFPILSLQLVLNSFLSSSSPSLLPLLSHNLLPTLLLSHTTFTVFHLVLAPTCRPSIDVSIPPGYLDPSFHSRYPLLQQARSLFPFFWFFSRLPHTIPIHRPRLSPLQLTPHLLHTTISLLHPVSSLSSCGTRTQICR